MRRSFYTLDVFTAQKFAGNPLAVVMNAEGLDDRAMQTIAREFNLSETVFVSPPANPAHRADLRIFTPGRELPFAGHPTVGTAALLGVLDASGKSAAAQWVLGEKVGPVPCDVTVVDAQFARAVFQLPKLPEQMPGALPARALAELLSLPIDAIGFERHVPALFSAGVPFPLVPVTSRAALDGLLSPGAVDMARVLGPAAGGHMFLYCKEPVAAQHHFYARMFAPGLGVPEDPATGSAVAAFAGAIMAFEKPGDGVHRLVIEQGYAMGRPSEIELTLHVRKGLLEKALIGGGAVIVSKGEVEA